LTLPKNVQAPEAGHETPFLSGPDGVSHSMVARGEGQRYTYVPQIGCKTLLTLSGAGSREPTFTTGHTVSNPAVITLHL
jgi:hypothetical protein